MSSHLCKHNVTSLQQNVHCILHNLFNDDDTFSRRYLSHNPPHQAHYAWMKNMFYTHSATSNFKLQ